MTNYDPQCIADIVFPSKPAELLIQSIITGERPFPQSGKNGILLYGVFGTGKTALAELLPDAIEAGKSGNPSRYRFERVQNGNNATALINKVQQQANHYPLFIDYHYFVLDEVDNLTLDAMKSLKSVMNIAGTIFILTTNNLNKVELGVQNRCHLVPFNAAPNAAWLPLVRRIISDNAVPVPNDQYLLTIISKSKGSARDVVDLSTEFVINYRKQHRMLNAIPVLTPVASVAINEAAIVV